MSDRQKMTAFEEALGKHNLLRERSRELRRYLEEPRPDAGTADASPWAAALCQHIVGLHDSISRHFLVEELGLLRELRSKFPAALPRLEKSREEHLQILAVIRGLVSDAMCYAEARPPEKPNLRQRTRDVLGQINAHEEMVTDLVQSLALTDTGTGD